MIRRLLLVVAAAAFVGWIAWLALAVSKAGTVPIVSRAQLTAATHLLVLDVSLDPENSNLPKGKTVTVAEVVTGEGVKSGDVVEVGNLSMTFTPGGKAITQPGAFLVPVVRTGEKQFRVAGLPRSPAYEASVPERPLIYPWTEEVKAQLRTIGLVK